MKTKSRTYKYLSVTCQVLTLLGIATGLGALCYMVWELGDLLMLENRLYSMAPDMQLPALLDVVDDVPEDVIEPAIVGGVSLVISMLTGLAGVILTCLTRRDKTESAD